MPMPTAADKTATPFYKSLYQFVSEAEINAARERQTQDGNECAMCRPDGAKGFVNNASQWICCFECNPTDSKNEKPPKLELSTGEQADYIESPHTCPFCRSSDGLDATSGAISENGEMHQPVKCYECRRKWTDVYVLSRIEAVELDEN